MHINGNSAISLEVTRLRDVAAEAYVVLREALGKAQMACQEPDEVYEAAKAAGDTAEKHYQKTRKALEEKEAEIRLAPVDAEVKFRAAVLACMMKAGKEIDATTRKAAETLPTMPQRPFCDYW